MLQETKDLLKATYKFKDETLDLYERAIKDVEGQFKMYDEIREYNQIKVLKAFQQERISDAHFTNSSGYGYDDIGRDSLDKVYARIFNAEAAIVRPHFVNGTHAIGAALFGNLRPGNKLLCVSGKPYDTLHSIIGISGAEKIGSLKEYGIGYGQVDLTEKGKFDFEKINEALEDKAIKIVHIQRSTGYGWRNSFLVSEIGEVISYIKGLRKDVNVFVDNCYGEFIDVIEPTDVGADIIAGSLIKNIGGGIAPAGGYIVGKEELVKQAAFRLTIPGIGGECGATFGL
ncbi:MAG TPA: methionine gamma-lyase family protein, partial [Clostridium sp.]